MRTTLRQSFACRKQRDELAELITWATATIAQPAAHHATVREAAIVADLLAQLGGVR